MVEKIRVNFKETSAEVVALDRPGKKDFNGSRVGMARVVSENDDLLTFYTAIKKKEYELFKRKRYKSIKTPIYNCKTHHRFFSIII